LRHAEQIKNVEAAARFQRQDGIGDIFGGVAADFAAALDTESLAAAGEK
jgi:hypothetical protein